MNNFKEYIIEKLRINKNTEVVNLKTNFKYGDPIIRIAIVKYYDNIVQPRLYINIPGEEDKIVFLSFNKFNDKNQVLFDREDLGITDNYGYEENRFINSEDYYEYHAKRKEWICWVIYLDLKSGIDFIKKLIDNEGRCAYLYGYFDKNDDLEFGIKLKSPLEKVKEFYNRLKKL